MILKEQLREDAEYLRSCEEDLERFKRIAGYLDAIANDEGELNAMLERHIEKRVTKAMAIINDLDGVEGGTQLMLLWLIHRDLQSIHD